MTSLILLVDDNAVQGTARRDILERAGVSVQLARNGEEALRMLAEPGMRASLGLLITDHLMPGMNGPALVRSMLAELPGLPVVVLSGLPGAEAEYVGLPVHFRLKPFPPGELIRLTRHLLGGQTLLSA